MTDLGFRMEPTQSAGDTAQYDQPRRIGPGTAPADAIFRNFVRIIGLLVMVLVGAIGIFLGLKLIPTVRHFGFHYFVETDFVPGRNVVGIASAVVGTIVIALIALVIAFPLAVLTALYISEYAPPRARSWLISVIDLMAAIPSIVYGIWGVGFLMPHMVFVARFLNQWLGWIPIFKVSDVDPRAASITAAGAYRYTGSAFIAGTVVALMVVPLATSLMRNVFSQAPIGERESAFALGSTRWGMVRSVVLPFGRGGIIGAMMLGLGRALGETIAVLLILNGTFEVKARVLESGGVTISWLIASKYEAATGVQLSALIGAGFVLFLMTLVVNTLAAIVIGKSRSGAGVEI